MDGPRDQLKREVLATVIAGTKANMRPGESVWSAVDRLYPDVPQGVRIQAADTLEDEAEEAWWDSLERTIDGEVLGRAIGRAGGD